VVAVVWLSHEEYLVVLDEQVRRFADAVAAGDPSARVESCPEWSLADLCRHQGLVHRWAAEAVRTRATARIGWSGLPDAEAPDEPEAMAGWLLRGASGFAELLRERGPAEPVWSWGVEQHSGFWARRMAHETLIHRIDAETAVGPVGPVDPVLAADNIDELLHNAGAENSRAHPKRELLRGEGGTLHLHSTDVPGEWTLRRTPEGFAYEQGHAKGEAAVRGGAVELMLLLNRRLPDGRNSLEILGDQALLPLWLEGLTFS
jgi:uncharacterized protein (TIGR03083 family)